MSGWLPIILAMAIGTGGDAGNVVVVRPSAWSPAIQAWKSHREHQGYRILEVEPGSTAEATRDIIRSIAQTHSTTPHFVVLAADAPAFFDRENGKISTEVIPTFYIDSKVVKNFGSEPTIASDHPYSEIVNDQQNCVAVGRIPVHSKEELEAYLAKVISYETSESFASWRREVDVVAGVGGFGAIADAVVEGVTRQLLTDDIPQEYRLSMTYASPTSVYYPEPTRFSDTAVERMNDGGIFWVYLGHGYVDTLDFIPFENKLLSILDRSSMQKVSIPSGPPIGIFLACYVGAFDARESSMAEQLLLQPQGPVAVVAGSRVTMPYAMGILGSEMLKKCFQDRTGTIGKILFQAKQSAVRVDAAASNPSAEAGASRRDMLDSLAKALSPEGHSIVDERTEHNYLFNLLGDPTLQIRHPRPLSIQTPEETSAGADLIVRGHAPISGRLVVELAYTRQRIPEAAKQLRQENNQENPIEKRQAVYQAANRLTVCQVEQATKTGDFAVTLPIDSACHGSYLIQATVYGDSDWSAGSSPIRIKR